MARSLKTKYLLLALAVGAVLSLVLGGLAYYEHRVDAADVNQLTYATVAQKLEADLETRASSLSEITGASLAPALDSGNRAAVTSIAQRLLDERDIERVEVLDARGTVLFNVPVLTITFPLLNDIAKRSRLRGAGPSMNSPSTL